MFKFYGGSEDVDDSVSLEKLHLLQEVLKSFQLRDVLNLDALSLLYEMDF